MRNRRGRIESREGQPGIRAGRRLTDRAEGAVSVLRICWGGKIEAAGRVGERRKMIFSPRRHLQEGLKLQQRMGVIPMTFVESRRIEKAKQLLLGSDLPVQQIGRDAGFPNAQHFSTRFRKLCGQSPSAFRKVTRRRFSELYPEEELPPQKP